MFSLLYDYVCVSIYQPDGLVFVTIVNISWIHQPAAKVGSVNFECMKPSFSLATMLEMMLIEKHSAHEVGANMYVSCGITNFDVQMLRYMGIIRPCLDVRYKVG